MIFRAFWRKPHATDEEGDMTRIDQKFEELRAAGKKAFVSYIMDLSMAVVAAGDAVICSGGHYLVKFDFSVLSAFFRKA